MKVVKDIPEESYAYGSMLEGEDKQDTLTDQNANDLADVGETLYWQKLEEEKMGKRTNSSATFEASQYTVNLTEYTEEENMFETENLSIDQAVENFKLRRGNQTVDVFDQFVILTTIDSLFINLMDNWLLSLRQRGLKYNITLICEDDKAFKYYVKKQNRHFKVLNTHDYKMLGKLQRQRGSYQQLIKRRTLYVRNLLFAGTDVLLADIDAVWLKDPLEIIRQGYNVYDIWVAEGYKPDVPCPCFLYMKSVPSVMKLAGQWMHRLSDNHVHPRRFESDQFALQHVMKRRPDLRKCSLDRVRFPTGKEFFDPDWNRANSKHVYVAHGNHLGRNVGKVDKFKEFGLWLLDN